MKNFHIWFEERQFLIDHPNFLPPRYKEIGYFIYALNIPLEVLFAKQIGERLGISKERVQNIRNKIKSAIKRYKESKVISDKYNDILDMPIGGLNLPMKAKIVTLLSKIQVFTVKDLISKTEDELLEINQFGRKCLSIIEKTLRTYGLSLKNY